jgi:hypothetical protein
MPYTPQRTGAASFYKVVTAACKFSHKPSFQQGFLLIAGDDTGARNVLLAWNTFCAIWESFLSRDDASGQIDATPGEGQDRPVELV